MGHVLSLFPFNSSPTEHYRQAGFWIRVTKRNVTERYLGAPGVVRDEGDETHTVRSSDFTALREQPGRNLHTGFPGSRYWRHFCGMREWVRILQKPCGCWGHDLLTFCHWQFTGRMKGSFCKGLSHKAFSSEWSILCPVLAKFKLHPC